MAGKQTFTAYFRDDVRSDVARRAQVEAWLAERGLTGTWGHAVVPFHGAQHRIEIAGATMQQRSEFVRLFSPAHQIDGFHVLETLERLSRR
jgi:hypothetical protein